MLRKLGWIGALAVVAALWHPGQVHAGPTQCWVCNYDNVMGYSCVPVTTGGDQSCSVPDPRFPCVLGSACGFQRKLADGTFFNPRLADNDGKTSVIPGLSWQPVSLRGDIAGSVKRGCNGVIVARRYSRKASAALRSDTRTISL